MNIMNLFELTLLNEAETTIVVVAEYFGVFSSGTNYMVPITPHLT